MEYVVHTMERRKRIQVRVLAAEMEEVCQAAAVSGRSVSGWVRWVMAGEVLRQRMGEAWQTGASADALAALGAQETEGPERK